MSARVLMLAARTSKERGGALVLLRPQRPAARLLGLLGADQMIMIRADAEVTPEMGSAAKDNPELTRSAHDVPYRVPPVAAARRCAAPAAGVRAKRSPCGRPGRPGFAGGLQGLR